MDWLKKLFSREAKPKIDLPKDWLEAPKVTTKPKPAAVRRKVDTVINLAEPARPPKANPKRGKIMTPVPAKKGKKTLDLAGKEDAFTRRSKSVIDMRPKQR